MSSYAEPDPTAAGLRMLRAAVAAYRAGDRGYSWDGLARRNPTSGSLAAADGTGSARRRSAGRPAAAAGSAGATAGSPSGAAGDPGAAVTGAPSGPPTPPGPPGPPPDVAAPPGRPAGGPAGAADAETDASADSWRLVRLAQAGDREAFGQLYDRYVGLVFRYAYHRLGDRALAEDVTSETFLRALRRIGSLSYQGRDVGAWFVTITRNLVLDHVKSGRYRLEMTAAELPETDRVADGPESAVLAYLTNAALLRCVRKLGAEQQECVVLRFLQGLSVAETAEIMGKNEGAIKALQHRAIRRLAALLPEDPR